jgi:putative methionine-R-sulfoxide reductase with GAF domain
VKPYLSTQKTVADITQLLENNQPSFHHSPLEDIASLLCEGRHYSWVGIYLSLDKHSSSPLLETAVHPAHVAVPGTRKKVLVAMKIAGREIGFLNVESERENALGPEDRVLLESVADLLARFLTGPGKYLVLKAAKSVPSPKAAAA